MSRPQSFLWVTKWVDYSNKYGFGYQLSNHSVGVLFNKGTHLSLCNQRKYASQRAALFGRGFLQNGLLAFSLDLA